MLPIVLLTLLVLTLCHAPFVWWAFILCGARVVTVPTDEDAIVLVEPDPDVIVDVEVEEP